MSSGMSQSTFENMSRIVANSGPPAAFVQQPYAFTELINVNWSKPVRLDDTSTAESQLWTRTLQIYSSHEGTTNIWYGQMVDTPLIFKLIIDWTSPDHHRSFHESTAFAQLLQAWQSSPTTITTDVPQFFKFPSDQRVRGVAFQLSEGYFKEAVTVFVTARFSTNWNPDATEPKDTLSPQRPGKVVWNNAWMLWSGAALRHEGGWVSDKAFTAWSDSDMSGGQRSFLGVVRFLDFRTACQFPKSAEDEKQSSADASFGRLSQLAEEGVYAEVVKMMPPEPAAQ